MTRTRRIDLHDTRGSALLLAVLVLMAASLLGGSIAFVAATDFEISSNYEHGWQAFYAADGGGRAAFGELVELTRTLGRFPTTGELSAITAPSMADVTFSDFRLRGLGNPAQQVLTTGFFHGLRATTGPYEVSLSAHAGDFNSAAETVSMVLDIDLIPIFQFAVFSQPDLALSSPEPVTLTGRVHTNSDLYLGGPADVRIEGAVTAHGDFVHLPADEVAAGVDAPPSAGPPPPSPAVELRTDLDSYADMNVDSSDSNWIDGALEQFRGNVRSGVHGVPRLRLAIPDPDAPRQIIEPALDTDTAEERATKIFYNAGLSINVLNGQGFDAAGNRVDLGDAVGFDLLHDAREQRDMLVVEIDIEALSALSQYPAANPSTVIYLGSFRPGNGIPDWEAPGGLASADQVMANINKNKVKVKGKYKVTLDGVVSKLKSLVQQCQQGKIQEAAKVYDEVLVQLDEAVAAGKITLTERNSLSTATEVLRTCAIASENTTTWPDAWDDVQPPYSGGNTAFAVKLVNGAKLVNDLTIVTANPMYVQGDYNTVRPKAAALMADGITVLSNAWGADDDDYSSRPLNARVAADTRLNAALLVGVSPGGSGGVGNMIRFLEDWSGRTFTYRGSLVTLWNPLHLTGAYVYGDPVFRAPTQHWAFDTALLDPATHPPATPLVYTLRMSEWRQQ